MCRMHNYMYSRPSIIQHLWSSNQSSHSELIVRISEVNYVFDGRISKFYLMHTTNAMNLVVWIIEGSNK